MLANISIKEWVNPDKTDGRSFII